MNGLQGTTWHDFVDIRNIEGLEKEDKLCFYLLFLFEALHCGHLQAVNHLSQHLEDAVDPGVAQFEDERLGALLHYVAGK